MATRGIRRGWGVGNVRNWAPCSGVGMGARFYRDARRRRSGARDGDGDGDDDDDDDASDGDANVRATRDYMLYACMRALQRGGESRARRGRFWRGAARARGRRRRRRRRLVRRDRATTMTVARWCFS